MAYAFPRGATTGMGLQLQQTVRYYYIEALGGACRSCDDLELPRAGRLGPQLPIKEKLLLLLRMEEDRCARCCCLYFAQLDVFS